MLLALPILLGCGSAPATPERDPVEPLSSGVTLYVLETFDDFLDDGMDITNSFDPPSRARWLGEQALRVALRAKATLARRQHAPLREGRTVEFFPDTPVHYLARDKDGQLRRRQHGELSGFHLTLGAESFQEKYVRLDYDLRLCRVDLEGGVPVLQEDQVERATRVIPVGGSLMFQVPRGDHRVWLVLVHVASVEPRGR